MLGDRSDWLLDPAVTFLNHGSFGACPRPVLEAQSRWRARMEAQPVSFLDRELPGLLGDARAIVGAFLRADPETLAFVPNATTGVNVVLRALALREGDEVVATDHAYGAVLHALRMRCAEAGARLVVVPVALPFPDDADIVAAIMGAVGDRTRLVIVDHISSATAAVFPVAGVVQACRARGVVVMVDAAHAPGMLDVDVRALGADFWVGNLHKWVCAPKGAAVLSVAGAREPVRPLVTSHEHLTGFHAPFDWQGTYDPTPYLAVPDALAFMGSLGWDEVRAHNDSLVREGRDLVLRTTGGDRLVRDDATASMASLPLPDGTIPDRAAAVALQARFFAATQIEVPFMPWASKSLLRTSAQVYNHLAEYQRLADALLTFELA